MTDEIINSPEAVSQLPGVNVLIEGPTGTGKTYAIGSLVDSGLEVFYLAMESGMETLLGYYTDHDKPIPPNLHWHKLAPSSGGLQAQAATAKLINTMSNEALAKMQDSNKSKYNQFVKLFEVLNDFPDQRTGEKFGSVEGWGVDKVLVIDALTGLNTAVMSSVVGGKPIKTLVDWGISMDGVEKILRSLTEGCTCHFVLLSHVEREVDQLLGGTKLTVGTLGVKLASKIPPMFSDVILSVREGDKFYWDTINPSADLKTRNLPLGNKIKPDFKQIIDKWHSRAYPK